MNSDDIRGLKYYLITSFALITFFVYSGMTGWNWFNSEKTEDTGSGGKRSPHTYRLRYHK